VCSRGGPIGYTTVVIQVTSVTSGGNVTLMAQVGGPHIDAALALGIGLGTLLVWGLVYLLLLVGMYKVFRKAGQPGWAVIVPFYNYVCLLRITRGDSSDWWKSLVPFYNIYFVFVSLRELAVAFGKDPAFGIGLFFLGPVFWPVLGFGRAAYVGPVAPFSGGYSSQTPGGAQTSGGAWSAPTAGLTTPGAAGDAWVRNGPVVESSPTWEPPSAPPVVAPSVAPGWYPLANDPGDQGYWDGHTYTGFQKWDGSAWVAYTR
jgi:hypothetical protein